MKIMQLQREDIPLVTKGGNQALVDEVTADLDSAELNNCVLFVRYGPMFLQRLLVDREFLLHTPEAMEMLQDEEMWERQRPNHDYHAETLKHARDYLKKHDPEVLDALFYTRDDGGKK
jgi:hypothetical protein